MFIISTLGYLLVIIGYCLMLWGGIWFLVVSFQKSIWWGLACLFLPIADILFLIVHWKDASKPFWRLIIGFGLLLLASPLTSQSGGN